MHRYLFLIFIIIAGLVSGYATSLFAATPVDLSGVEESFKEVSIGVDIIGDDAVSVSQGIGFSILSLVKVIVSGFALIYIVMIGVYMVIFSDNEEKVKTQRRQITYALVGFLFLNIPGILYEVMNPGNASDQTIVSNSWSDTSTLWYAAGLDGFVGNIIAFFRVFAYGAAAMMLTWGFFQLILSSGDEEKAKLAKGRVTYSLIALMFMFFIEGWTRMLVGSDIATSVASMGGSVFRLALFFAAPIALFFIIYGAYYYITSAGDEERVKKGKNILINTLIATLILLASFTFLVDISENFTL